VLVDDHPLWRETLRKVIERNAIGAVVAEASDGDEAIKVVLATRPDLVVMDMALPTVGGVEATARIRAELPETRVLVLSSFEDRSSVLDAVRAGAAGYLLKTAGAKEVADAVRRVADGELVFPPKLANVVLEEFRRLAGAGAPPAARALVVASDSVIHLEGLTQVLEKEGFDVIGTARDVDELESVLKDGAPDALILDFHAEPDRGIRAAARVREAHGDLPVLVLSQDGGSASAFELLSNWETGVGFLMRDRVANVDELCDSIQRVASGGSVIDPEIVDRLVGRSDRPGALTTLTRREREVLALMAEGHSNQGISDRLFLSGKTLEKHVRAIFSKLGLEETTDVHRRVLAVLAYLRSA
jgi:DNA-binding NarL/FixJ family response regulator